MSGSLSFATSAALFATGKLGGAVLPLGWWPCWVLLGAAAVSLYLELWLRNIEAHK
jgi:predicted permease